MVFDYEDRYELKKTDPSKSVFTTDPKLSKLYSQLLMQQANSILPTAEDFFDLDDSKR